MGAEPLRTPRLAAADDAGSFVRPAPCLARCCRTCNRIRAGALSVVAPATHDTASAVAGTPLRANWAFISSGTWSLVGCELDCPLLNDAAAQADFTNKAGACGTVRFLKNVMGLWILERCRQEWQAAAYRTTTNVLEQVARITGFAGFVFPDDLVLRSASMAAEVRAALVETGQMAADNPVRLTKVILDSLALRYASVIQTLEQLTGRAIEGVHIVGGGSLNNYLNQATADASGRPVTAGPSEATAAGNVLLQAMACGTISSLAEGRRRLRHAAATKEFLPRSASAWAEAAKRYEEVEAR